VPSRPNSGEAATAVNTGRRLASSAGGYWRAVRQATTSWLEHDGPRLAASLSLYTLLSLAPLVILSIAIAALAFGHGPAQRAVIDEMRGVMGPDGARTIRTVIEHGSSSGAGSTASVLGVLILLFGASSVFAELQSGLNKVWQAQAPKGYGLAALIKSRLVSFTLVLAFGFLLVVSLLLSAALAAFGRFFTTHLALPQALLRVITLLISFGGIFVLIGLIFRYIPDVPLRWRDVWEGAFATSVLFTIGKALLGLYLGTAAVGSAYGAAGSLIAVIIWVYYFAMIFYFGAEFTRVSAAGRKQPPRRTDRKEVALEKRR
jgi:membrane protein